MRFLKRCPPRWRYEWRGRRWRYAPGRPRPLTGQGRNTIWRLYVWTAPLRLREQSSVHCVTFSLEAFTEEALPASYRRAIQLRALIEALLRTLGGDPGA